MGDAAGLAALLQRYETEGELRATLQAHCHALRPPVDPSRERQIWSELLAELFSGGGAR